MLRHERMTVPMALAEFSHHSSRGQRMARAGVWGHEQNYMAKIRKPPTPQPELFSLEEEPGGGLPAPLSEVAGRQEKVERHVVEDLGELVPLVQILDLPVPQMVDNVLDALRIPVSPMAVQVVEVATILIDVIPALSLVPRRNNWWKCRPCCLPPASPCGSRSRSSTLLFLVVVVKVFSQNRVQQRRFLLVNAADRRHFFFWWWPWTGVFLVCWSCR